MPPTTVSAALPCLLTYSLTRLLTYSLTRAQVADQKKAARGEKPKIQYESAERVSVAAKNAEERKKNEEEYAEAKKKFKRRWRPPGLMLY